jgi:hypothetical protein
VIEQGLDAQQAVLLGKLRRAAGRPVSYRELQEAGVEYPASVVEELELAGLPVERTYLNTSSGRRLVSGVRLRSSPRRPGTVAPPRASRGARPPRAAARPPSRPREPTRPRRQLALTAVGSRWRERADAWMQTLDRRVPARFTPLLIAATAAAVAAAIALTVGAGGSRTARRSPTALTTAARHGSATRRSRAHAGAGQSGRRAAPQTAPARSPSPPAAAAPAPAAPSQPGAAAATPAPAGPPAKAGGSSAAQLEAQGHSLLQAGRAGEAVPVLEEAVAATGESVERCIEPGSEACFTYAYALYDLGTALRLDGQAGAAVPILERRLQIDNQRATVADELALARDQAVTPLGPKRKKLHRRGHHRPG